MPFIEVSDEVYDETAAYHLSRPGSHANGQFDGRTACDTSTVENACVTQRMSTVHGKGFRLFETRHKSHHDAQKISSRNFPQVMTMLVWAGHPSIKPSNLHLKSRTSCPCKAPRNLTSFLVTFIKSQCLMSWCRRHGQRQKESGSLGLMRCSQRSILNAMNTVQ